MDRKKRVNGFCQLVSSFIRNLANHRVRVVVCVPQKLVDSQTKASSLLSTEMKLLKLTDAKIVHSINGQCHHAILFTWI